MLRLDVVPHDDVARSPFVTVGEFGPGNMRPQFFKECVAFIVRQVEELAKTNSPLQRIGQPDEVAAMAIFLLSDEASFCTGMAYDVNGGR